LLIDRGGGCCAILATGNRQPTMYFSLRRLQRQERAECPVDDVRLLRSVESAAEKRPPRDERRG